MSATDLVRAGVESKMFQKLMRHSASSLTMDLYPESDAQRLTVVVDVLPEVEKVTPRLTG